MKPEKKSWTNSLFAYAEGEKKSMIFAHETRKNCWNYHRKPGLKIDLDV